jgi:hypothetical protein
MDETLCFTVAQPQADGHLKPVYRTARNCGRIESFGDIHFTLDARSFAQYRPTAQFFIGPSPSDVTYEMSMDATVGEVVSLNFKHMMYKLPREVRISAIKLGYKFRLNVVAGTCVYTSVIYILGHSNSKIWFMSPPPSLLSKIRQGGINLVFIGLFACF